MEDTFFYKLGKFVYRFRKSIIFIWVIMFLCCLPWMQDITKPFKSTGFVAKDSESAITKNYIDKNIKYFNNRIMVIYYSPHHNVNKTKALRQIKKSLKNLKKFPISSIVFYPGDAKNQISKDKDTAYAAVLLKSDKPLSPELLQQFKQTIKAPPNMRVSIGGDAMFVDDINKQTQRDLYKADLIAAPISVAVLLLVFGTVVAALIPIILGGGCAILILTLLFALGNVFSLSVFTLNIALLLGLCLSLDYALFIIYRFREELYLNDNILEIIARTLATAGKAIFFSGLAVFVSLSALLLFPINILFSVGIGGLAAVLIAVLIAITLLPAILSVVAKRINFGSLYKYQPSYRSSYIRFWQRLAVIVVKTPIRFFLISLLILLTLGYPFLHVRLSLSDFHILPKEVPSRVFFDTYEQEFNINELTPILMLVSSPNSILSKQNLNDLNKLIKEIKKHPSVKEVRGIISTKSQLKSSQYYTLYSTPKSLMPNQIKDLLATTTKDHATVFSIISRYNVHSYKTKELIQYLRDLEPTVNLSLHITGVPANNLDVFENIKHIFPIAVAWIMALTYIILLILFRSIFLPLKAIIMNMLSLCASYGVLVFIFQDGNLHELLNFNPQGILDISLLIIIFCALFGFSMDYEVFLLSRIQECYQLTHHHRKSIVFGIVKSSRIITSAALIVICLCGSFMVADDLMVKEFGLGIAAAIFVDAFIIRILFVPATMVLMKKWNWYFPKWLKKILP